MNPVPSATVPLCTSRHNEVGGWEENLYIGQATHFGEPGGSFRVLLCVLQGATASLPSSASPTTSKSGGRAWRAGQPSGTRGRQRGAAAPETKTQPSCRPSVAAVSCEAVDPPHVCYFGHPGSNLSGERLLTATNSATRRCFRRTSQFSGGFLPLFVVGLRLSVLGWLQP